MPVADRLDIHELVAEYSYRCDTRQFDGISELFAMDGVFDESALGMPVANGRAAIAQYFAAFGSGMVEWFIHFNGNQRFTSFAGNTASGTSHLHAEGHLAGKGPARILGYMADDYVKADGRWLFQRRVLVNVAPLVGF